MTHLVSNKRIEYFNRHIPILTGILTLICSGGAVPAPHMAYHTCLQLPHRAPRLLPHTAFTPAFAHSCQPLYLHYPPQVGGMSRWPAVHGCALPYREALHIATTTTATTCTHTPTTTAPPSAGGPCLRLPPTPHTTLPPPSHLLYAPRLPHSCRCHRLLYATPRGAFLRRPWCSAHQLAHLPLCHYLPRTTVPLPYPPFSEQWYFLLLLRGAAAQHTRARRCLLLWRSMAWRRAFRMFVDTSPRCPLCAAYPAAGAARSTRIRRIVTTPRALS